MTGISEGTYVLRVIRRKTLVAARGNTYRVLIDDREQGVVHNGEMVDIPIQAGRHEFQLVIAGAPYPPQANRMGHMLASRPVEIMAHEILEFVCGPGAADFFPFSRVDGKVRPDIMLKPKPSRVTRHTWRSYD